MADRVTLDTGNSVEGRVREKEDTVLLDYCTLLKGRWRIRTMVIPRTRITKIELEPDYIRRFEEIARGLGSYSPVLWGTEISQPFSAKGEGLSESVRKGGRQLQKGLDEQKEHMRKSKFYSGWHEGFHWDPNNGWHRWNHQGLYDPDDSNITVKQ